MIRLHAGSGAWDVELLGPATSDEDWAKLKSAAFRLLKAREQHSAARRLSEIPFSIGRATNHFQDSFCVLYRTLPIEQYAEMSEVAADPAAKRDFKHIADTISEIGPYIRHVVAYPQTDEEPRIVTNPEPRLTTHSVELALMDAEQLLYSRGAPSAIDRVHTALHGYLTAICEDQGLDISEDASLTQLFKTLRKSSDALGEWKGSADKEAQRLLGGVATIVDSLNTIRNRMSAAHPSKNLLEEAEAVLAVNCGRTLLHYVDAKLK